MQRIDAAVRGRVASVLMLASFGIMPISFALAGFLIAWSLKFTFLIADLALLITAAGHHCRNRSGDSVEQSEMHPLGACKNDGLFAFAGLSDRFRLEGLAELGED
jgi:hypothetical protein